MNRDNAFKNGSSLLLSIYLNYLFSYLLMNLNFHDIFKAKTQTVLTNYFLFNKVAT